MKAQIEKLLSRFKLTEFGLAALLLAIPKLLDTLKLSKAEKKKRAEMATAFLLTAHCLRAFRDDARYSDFRGGLADLGRLTSLADVCQEAAVGLFAE